MSADSIYYVAGICRATTIDIATIEGVEDVACVGRISLIEITPIVGKEYVARIV